MDGLTASSAGIRAVIGHPMHSFAALVLESLGGDASDFTARQFTPKIGSSADLVLTMTTSQREAVLERAPRLLHRTYSISEAARIAAKGNAVSIEDLADERAKLCSTEIAEIEDPIGEDIAVFEKVGSQIADLLPPILHLCRRSSMS